MNKITIEHRLTTNHTKNASGGNDWDQLDKIKKRSSEFSDDRIEHNDLSSDKLQDVCGYAKDQTARKAASFCSTPNTALEWKRPSVGQTTILQSGRPQ